jgi:hypothetical protein
LNNLLHASIYRADMNLVRYWLSLGADINHVLAEGESLHRCVIWKVWTACDRRMLWRENGALNFAHEWFSQDGAKWAMESRDERQMLRDCLGRLGPYQAYDFVQLLCNRKVTEAETLATVLDTPKLKAHLSPRAPALGDFLPSLRKWSAGRPPRRVRHSSTHPPSTNLEA